MFRRGARRSSPETSSSRPAATVVDICFLTDLRFPGGTSTSLATEIRAAHLAGYSVGVVQVDSVHLRHDRITHPLLQTLFDDGAAIRILPGEPVLARLTLVRHPYVLARSLGGALPLTTEQVIVICGQVPVDGDARVLYDPVAVHAHCLESTGYAPTWWPVSTRVRTALEGTGVPLASEDWVETIDLTDWPMTPIRTDRLADMRTPATATVRRVIGRHSRDDPMKWPADPAVIRAVYPEAPDLEVRILGGATHAIERLGHTPGNWTILGYGTEQPTTFLAGLDAVVYYPHPELIEAFGRTVLEALASGVVTVAPAEIAAAFHGACLAAAPEDAIDTLRALWADPPRWAATVTAGRQIVTQHFSTEVFISRLGRLCGEPPTGEQQAGSPDTRAVPDLDRIPSVLRAQRPVILFTLLGAEPPAVEAAVRTLAATRAVEGGFHPILVITGPRPALATELGITCTSITGQRTWQGEGSWPEYVRRRLRQLATSHRADRVIPIDVTSPLAWISLGAPIARAADAAGPAPA